MDTLKLHLTINRPREVIKLIKSACNNYTCIIGQNYKSHKGKYNNLTCSLTGNSLTFTGSISKLMQESNQYDLDTYDIATIINELSYVFNIDASKATVYRLDYAENLIMDHDVGKYIEILSAGSTGKPFRISDESFYVLKHKKKIIAYNKIKDLKNDNVFLHPNLIGKNVLRFEVRWFGDLHKSLNIPELTFGMLKEHKVIKQIKRLWAAEVLSLNFKHAYLANFDYSSPKTLESSLASYGIQARGGFDIVLQDLNRQKNLTAQQKYRHINKLKEINTINACDTTKILADEIKEKVNIAAESYKEIFRMLPYTI